MNWKRSRNESWREINLSVIFTKLGLTTSSWGPNRKPVSYTGATPVKVSWHVRKAIRLAVQQLRLRALALLVYLGIYTIIIRWVRRLILKLLFSISDKNFVCVGKKFIWKFQQFRSIVSLNNVSHVMSGSQCHTWPPAQAILSISSIIVWAQTTFVFSTMKPSKVKSK